MDLAVLCEAPDTGIMAETASREALQNALVLYAPAGRELFAKVFLEALSVDELLFLAEFLGSCILVTSTIDMGTWDAVFHRAQSCHRAIDKMNVWQREDMDHKLIVVTEFAERCGFAIKFK